MCASHLSWVLVLIITALCTSAGQSAEFLGLGHLPGDMDSGAVGVSADGTVVVGWSEGYITPQAFQISRQAFRWTEADGMVGLGNLGYSSSVASGVSANGTVVAGRSYNESSGGPMDYPASQAFRWNEADGMVGLGYLPGDTHSFAHGVSADGAVIVGESARTINSQAFRWTETGGMVALGYLPGGTWSQAYGVSADGAVVVGMGDSDIGGQAYRWTEANGMVGLGRLPGGFSWANGVSSDGAVIVGWNRMDIGTQAIRWTETGGMVGLGYLPGGTSSSAIGISADGAVIVGESGIEIGDQTFTSQAIRWTEDDGMESIDVLLLSSVGLTGWRLERAYEASEDGSVIVGSGVNPDGNHEAWVADIGDIAPLPTNPIDISGTIKTENDVDICAMVLASGQFTFSCNPPGEFALTDIPRENYRTVKRQIYADGFLPKIDILTNSTDEAVVMTYSGTCPSYNASYDPGFFPDAAGKKIDISGIVLLQDTQMPICGIVLANGQYMFTCDGTGRYALYIPLDTNGQFKLQVYADGFAPTVQTLDEFQAITAVRMARAAQCH